MNAHDRAVDHLHPAIVRLDDCVHHAVPDTGFAPAVETIIHRRIGPIPFGQIAPGRTRSQHIEHPVENAPVVFRHRPRPARWQQRLGNAPLVFRQIVAHDPSSDVLERESLFEPRV